MKIESLSIVLPAYNEEANIEAAAREAVEVAETLTSDFEVVVVNDGSQDRTGDILESLKAEDPRIVPVHHETNLGYGGALSSGFRATTKKLVFYTDGDRQFRINEIHKLLPLLDKADIVSGYRAKRQDPPHRLLNAYLYGLSLRVLFGLNMKDVDCAFKIYRHEVFEQIKMETQGSLIDAEIMIRARRAGFTFCQTPVTHYPRPAGKQTGASLRVVARAFKELFLFRLRLFFE